MSFSLPPRSGNQYIIESGDYRAVVTQQGAALRSLTYKGRDVIIPFGSNDTVTVSRGQLLIPFPNRIADGEYSFEGVAHSLPIDEHDRHNAIHGYGYRSLWTPVSASETQVELTWRAPNIPGYPFDVIVNATYTLDDEGLGLTVKAWNHGSANAPWAMAIHPWIANGINGYGDRIESDNGRCALTIPADTHVTVDDRLLPTGTEPVDGTAYDLRESTIMEGRHFDDAWTDLLRDESGHATARLIRPDGMTVDIHGDSTVTSFQVCTGTGFPEKTRPAGIAVEPQTAYANAFNTGIDLTVIHPDETVSTTVGISASIDDAS